MDRFISNLIKILIIWVVVTSGIDRLKNPQLTETQLMYRLPNAMMLDFDIK